LVCGRPVPERICKYYYRKILIALNYLHSNFVAHCDIKPENIILTSEIDLQIADFSVACDLRGPNGDGKINTYQGTLEYMAPELNV
jgi:serine/threonine protein kinase